MTSKRKPSSVTAWWDGALCSLKPPSAVTLIPMTAAFNDENRSITKGTHIIAAYADDESLESAASWVESVKDNISLPLFVFRTEVPMEDYFWTGLSYESGYQMDEDPHDDYLKIGNLAMAQFRQDCDVTSNQNISHMYLSKFLFHECQAYCEDVLVCIAVHVFHKGYLPYHDRELPKTVDVQGHKIKVDIREGGVQYNMLRDIILQRQYNIHTTQPPLRIGSSLMANSSENIGTIGCFVTRTDSDGDEEVGVLTAAHVVANPESWDSSSGPSYNDWCASVEFPAFLGDEDPRNPQEIFFLTEQNTAIDHVGSEDVAIIWTQKSRACWGTKLEPTTFANDQLQAKLHNEDLIKSNEWRRKGLPPRLTTPNYEVLKVGFRTGLTTGVLSTNNTLWQLHDIPVWLVQRPRPNMPRWEWSFLVRSKRIGKRRNMVVKFSEKGDSGSMVWIVGEVVEGTYNLYPCGILVGEASNNADVVIPFERILEKLEKWNIFPIIETPNL